MNFFILLVILYVMFWLWRVDKRLAEYEEQLPRAYEDGVQAGIVEERARWEE